VRLDIQGLRAFALLLILAFHARAPISGGFVALDVFFVISGFVIIQMLMRENERSNRISLKTFYVRRFRRLTPALSLTVSVVVLMSILLQSPFGPEQVTAATGIGAMLFSANFVIAYNTGSYFDAPAEHNPLLNLWSLSAEEQFYLIFPALMVLAWFLVRKHKRLKNAPLIILVALAVTTFVLSVITSHTQLSWPMTGFFGYYGAVGRAWEFAIGAILGLLAVNLKEWPRWTAELLGWSGLALILFGCFAYSATTTYPGVPTLAPVLGTAAMITAGTVNTSSVTKILSVRPMVFIGDMSYSWYLWHWPFIVYAIAMSPRHPILAAMFGVVASFIPAYISYRFIEKPIREARDYTKKATGRLVAVTYGIPLAAAGFLAFGASKLWWTDWPKQYSYTQFASYKCHDAFFAARDCTFTSGSNGTVMLLGDSQALSMSDGLISAARDLNLTSIVSSHSECPFILPNKLVWTYENSACATWQTAALTQALSVKPDVVFIANRPYFNGLTENVALLNGKGQVTSGMESQQAWSVALQGVIGPLIKEGIAVVLVDPIPDAEYDIPAGGILDRPTQRTTTLAANSNAALAQQIDAQLAGSNVGTTVFNPIPSLCGPTYCPEFLHGDHLYADARHLSPPGAQLLRKDLKRSIAEAMRQARTHSPVA